VRRDRILNRGSSKNPHCSSVKGNQRQNKKKRILVDSEKGVDLYRNSLDRIGRLPKEKRGERCEGGNFKGERTNYYSTSQRGRVTRA